jgi:hypothetical protein
MCRCRAFTGRPPTKAKCNGGVSSERLLAALSRIVMLSAANPACRKQASLCAFLRDHHRAEFADDNADYFFADCSSASAISSNFRTVFQFLPVNAIFSVRSTVAMGNVGRAMPFGK